MLHTPLQVRQDHFVQDAHGILFRWREFRGLARVQGLDNDWSDFGNKKPPLLQYLHRKIMTDMVEEYPDVPISPRTPLHDAMLAVSKHLKKKELEKMPRTNRRTRTNFHKFIVIIDEWDLLLRGGKRYTKDHR